uniref:Putative ABC transport system ATP-binding protein n=1 Tax=Candidatus Kentrum sp. UNK TaxID=2126344 RepID=A0A451AYG5_9GAMM|nr:MAG: putative ABC transport system ATP-binding protein [Candidatus Kentron sp. UNK]VFK71095.1 MAG: putative ABC transport system ATP-binding protein [Candidatus Kentron sp. UNK]
MPTPIISLKNIHKEYAIGENTLPVLRGVDLDVYPGDYLAIMGPSGSGKSTLMNIMGCLDSPDKGQVIFNSRDISQADDRELSRIRSREIGFVFQSFNLVDYLSVYDNVALPFLYHDKPVRVVERVTEVLAEVGLSHRLTHRPSQLSGGERQRVAIARAMVVEPTIVLADEPTGNLDTKTGDDILALFERLNDAGTTIVSITHDAHVSNRARRRLRFLDGNWVV